MKKRLLFLVAFIIATQGWSQGSTLNEGFEGQAFPPNGWSTYNIEGNKVWERHTANNPIDLACASVSSGPLYYLNVLATPKLYVNSINDNLKFSIKTPQVKNNTYFGVIIIREELDFDSFDWEDEDIEDYMVLALDDSGITTSWQEHTVNLADYEGEVIYIAFVVYTNNGSIIMIDNVMGPEIFETSCQTPENLIVYNITTNSVDIGFEPGDDDSEEWVLFYKEKNEQNWETVEITSNPYNLDNLETNTDYIIRLKEVCENGEVSDFSNSVSFKTKCEDINSIPWSEDFNSYAVAVDNYPDCWTINSTSTQGPQIHSLYYSPPTCLCLYTDAGAYNIAAIPKMGDNIAINTLKLNFNYHPHAITDTLRIGVMTDPDNESTWEEVGKVYLLQTWPTWEAKEVSLVSYTGNGKYIAFRNGYSNISSRDYIDDLVITYNEDIPSTAGLFEDFEGNQFPPEGWKTVTVSGGVSWERYTGGSPLGDACASVNFYNPNHINYLITPKLVINSIDDEISFWLKTPTYYSGTTVNILISTTDSDVASFEATPLLTLSNAQITTTWSQYNIGLEDYVGENIYIAFQVVDQYGMRIMIDDIGGPELFIPSCAKPKNITLSNISATDVEISWTSGNPNDNTWIIYYKEEGETNWNSVNVFTSTHTLIGLTDDTEYELYIVTDCDGEHSEPSPSLNFHTLCIPIDGISDLPWEEGFEDLIAASTLPSCWSATRFGTYTNTQIYNNGSYNRNARTGNGAAYFRWGADDRFITPSFYLYEGDSYEFSFWYISDGLSGWQTLKATVNNPDGTTEIIGDIVNSPLNTTYLEYLGSFIAPENGIYTFDIICNANSSPYYLTIDDIKLQLSPSCTKPSNITATNISATSAEINWIKGNDGDNSWWLYYRESGEIDWDSISTYSNHYTLTNLIARTQYEIMIRTNCDSEVSDPSNIYVFTTHCYDGAITEFPWEEGFEDGLLCWEQINTAGNVSWTTSSNHNAARTGVGFANFYNSSYTTTSTILISPLLDVTDLIMPYISFWHLQKDWTGDQDELKVLYRANQDDDWTQLAYYNNSILNYQYEEIALPNPSSTYQIAFQGFSNYGKGVAIDDITIYDAFVCLTPENIIIAPGIRDANISWTSIGDENEWEIRLGEDGDTISVLNMHYTLTGLDPESDYTLYLRSNCGIECSDWIYAEFTTLAVIPPTVITEDVVVDIIDKSAELYASITEGSEEIILMGFEYKSSANSWNDATIITVTDINSVNAEIEELSDDTYLVRAFAETIYETTYGNEVEFVIYTPTPPTVITEDVVVDIIDKSAELYASITEGSEEIISMGFEYKSSANSWNDATIITVTDINSVNAEIEELSDDTYLVRAFAETIYETTYGNEVEFVIYTPTPPIVVTDSVAVDQTNEIATFFGTITEGSEEIIRAGFEFKALGDEWDIATIINIDNYSDLTATTPQLVEANYEVRAFAETIYEVTYGEELNFEITSSIIEISIDNLDISLYPNPSNSTTTISIKGVNGKAKISIIDASGRIITEIEKASLNSEIKHSFNISNYALGLYYMKVKYNNSINTRKLIIQ